MNRVSQPFWSVPPAVMLEHREESFSSYSMPQLTGWCVESVISASVIVLVIRTRKPFLWSMPGRYLLIATIAIVAGSIIFPYSPLAGIFGFRRLPLSFLFVNGIIVLLYIAGAEVLKRFFYRKVGF